MTITFLVASLLLVPLVVSLVDLIGATRARFTRGGPTPIGGRDDFHVLVPIYGAVRYLENVDYLADYGSRVVLCTTREETPEFYDELQRIATAHDFRIFYGAAAPATGARTGQRQTGGTTRDRLIRDALRTLTLPYVVCIDADTVTARPLSELVGAIAAGGFDVVSVPLRPSNPDSWLGHLQAHEYRIAMSLRRIMPWMVSGGCHGGRTEAMAHVMTRHSLFFQGNDVETGVIADALGYRVGHIPFDVPTTVPDRIRPWLRQRLAWAGGEFRLFVVNAKLVRRHPFLWLYGLLIMLIGLPLRWYTAVSAPRVLVGVLAVYLLFVTLLNWRHRDRWLLLMPFYAAVNSMLLVALSLPSYVVMAGRSKNAGVILRRRRHVNRDSGPRPGAVLDGVTKSPARVPVAVGGGPVEAGVGGPVAYRALHRSEPAGPAHRRVHPVPTRRPVRGGSHDRPRAGLLSALKRSAPL